MHRVCALFCPVACVVGAMIGLVCAPVLATQGAGHAAVASVISAAGPAVAPVTIPGPAVPAAVPAVPTSPSAAFPSGVGTGSLGAGDALVPQITAAAPGRHSPLVATAVRHVPTAAEPASPGQLDPLTDKATVLLIGWVMLVLLGGGLFAGIRRDPARRPGTTEAGGRPSGP